MIVALDNTFLSLLMNPNTLPTPNPATGQPTDYCALRVEALIDTHSRKGDTVLIPTPCLAEMLCIVPDFEKAIAEIGKSAALEIAPFDARCAIDLAQITRTAIANGDKKSGQTIGWQQVKFDRQIAVIAKTSKAELFYTDDAAQTHFAQQIGLAVKHTWDLDLPSKYAQTSFQIDPA